ncbi:MAG: hypothetical protein GXO57_09225 [Thermodesulfobacteria bacterium]|nr:hypothetical protein [Thermodesulfobacteriota bacterium]
MKKVKTIFLMLTIFVLSSCCGITQTKKISYFNWGTNLKQIRKIAILPFQNYTNDKEIAATVREVVLAEVLSQGIFDVVDPALTDQVVFEEGIGKNLKFDAATLKRIGKKLGVQAVLVGSVTYLKMERDGSYVYPVVGLSLRLIDVNTGKIIWECKAMKSGYSFWGKLFGLEPKSTLEIVFELVQDMLKDWKE